MSMFINSFWFKSDLPAIDVNWSPAYDDITGAPVVGAWGLRKLVTTHTGAVVRIRDTTGGAEQDVGLGADGWLDTFTVTGNAAVVTLYDQSGNANHLTQSDTNKQPLIVRPGVSFSGRPSIRFDGSNDFLRDYSSGTTKAYMVAYPIIAVEAAGRGIGSNWAVIAGIPHIAGANTSPYDRWSVRRYSGAGNDLQLALSGASAATTSISNAELAIQKSIGAIFLASHADVILDGSRSVTGPAAAGASVTYPNATGVMLGANGAGSECFGGEITALVILSDNVSSAATIQTWHDNIHQKNLAKNDDVVLDVTFTGGSAPIDTSDRAHPVWLSDGATVNEGYLKPNTNGAAIIAPSGLLSFATNFTFEVEINLTSLITNRRIATKGHLELFYGWTLSTHDVNSDELMLLAGNSYLVTGEHGSQANLTTGSWYTIRVTRFGNLWKIYVNTIERASRTFTPTNAMYTGTPLLVGNNNLRSLPFPGYIRNLKIWSGVALVP